MRVGDEETEMSAMTLPPSNGDPSSNSSRVKLKRTVWISCLSKLFISIALALAITNSIFVAYSFYTLSLHTETKNYNKKLETVLGNQTEDLVWFVQVSDLHFSKYESPERSQDFQNFCQYSNEILQPRAFIITGDITDAKTKDHTGSRQNFKEWNIYNQTMKKCGANKYDNNTLWLDIRGNHDTLNVPNVHEDFYRHFGIVKESRSYSRSFEHKNKSYGFVALDATQIPGPKRPFNFFGSIDKEELGRFKNLILEAQTSTNYQIVIGHYPISCLRPSYLPELQKSLISESQTTLAYLCGHLHQHVPSGHLYTNHFDKFYELEVGDWKSNRIFRFMAIDHGQLVFKDLKYEYNNNESIVLLLNPMDMSYIRPKTFNSIQSSTHIRALAMGINITNVVVKIDEQGDQTYVLEKSLIKNNLFLAPWDATKYNDSKVHTVEMSIHYFNGTVEKQKESTLFSLKHHEDLDQTSLLAKMTLKVNFFLLSQLAFGMCSTIVIVPLYILRSNSKYLSSNWKLIKGLAENVATKDEILMPICIASLWVNLGPWACGYFLEDHCGLLFAWGLFVYGDFLQADATYFYGTMFIFSYLVIFILALTFRRSYTPEENFFYYWLKTNILYLIILSLQIYQAVLFYQWYGLLASLSPCGVGRIWFLHSLWKKSNPNPDMTIQSHLSSIYFSRRYKTT
jgi:hypothetical protein